MKFILLLGCFQLTILYAQEINKSDYILFNSNDASNILKVMKKDGIGELSLDKVKKIFSGAYQKNKYSVTEYNTYYLLTEEDTETLAGKISIYDYKQSPSNQMFYSFTSDSTIHNYNITQSQIINKMAELGLENPEISKGSSATRWTWKWNSSGFKCGFDYSFNRQENWQAINYTCNRRY